MRSAALLLMIPVACLAQAPKFDAASVKLDPRGILVGPNVAMQGGPGTKDPGRFNISYGQPLKLIMTKAYDVAADQIVGPSWLDDKPGNLYIITATMPAGTTKAQFQLMLQNLLAERVGLAVHHETRDFPGYALTVASDKLKISPWKADPNAVPLTSTSGLATDAQGFPQLLASQNAGFKIVRHEGSSSTIFETHHQTMAEFANGLGQSLRRAGIGDADGPIPRVMDKTGLSGTWDLRLQYDGGFAGPARGDADFGYGLSFFTEIEKQLGLKLVKVKGVPVDVIVIDHVEKAPTGN